MGEIDGGAEGLRMFRGLPMFWKALILRVIIGVVSGLLFGMFFFAIALLAFLFSEDRHQFVAKYGGIWTLLAVYLGGGGSAGLIGGFLAPLGKSVPGAILAGWIAAVPMIWAVLRQIEGPMSTWRKDHFILGLILVVLLGGVGGIKARQAVIKTARERQGPAQPEE